ncbi:MAG: methionyl-tRNA formyltransferase [Actinomycetota bacterium]|nr:methionyl-tRNA formyltransferase [Actinomycetota bacterium]
MSAGVEVVAVVTNPDRAAGRKLELRASPVKSAAVERGLEIVQPDRVRDPDFEKVIRQLAPEVCVVVAYGKILPGSLLEVPPFGFVNVHFSLLPLYRGAAPVQRALMDGVDETGISIMVLTEGMDEGPVLARRSIRVAPEETAGQLGPRLAAEGAVLLAEVLPAYVSGELEPLPQDHDRATYAPKVTADEARLDWTKSAREIHNQVRGLNPEPGAWTTFRGKRLKVLRTIPRLSAELEPGLLVEAHPATVATGNEAVELVEVQPAGKRVMAGEDFIRGLRPAAGEPFE